MSRTMKNLLQLNDFDLFTVQNVLWPFNLSKPADFQRCALSQLKLADIQA